MSNMMIIGSSGSGKSRSLKYMDPETTFLIKVRKKELPYRGEKKQFKLASKETKGNMFITDDYAMILAIIKKINTHPEWQHIHNLIIDDYQYVMAQEFMSRAYEKKFDKFNEFAVHSWNILADATNDLRNDLSFIVMTHSDMGEDGIIKSKTIGKLTDKLTVPEGLFTIVLHTKVSNDEYVFQTQSEGTTTAKSPEEMFERFIPNDLNATIEIIEKYYNGEEEEEGAGGEEELKTTEEDPKCGEKNDI